ncbi:MAG: serine hydrolase domain-containing protein, partial [Clostridia bacterium]
MNFNPLDEFLCSLEKRGKSGTDCAVYLDGRQVHRHMHGLADRENGISINEETLYRMFSMTKPITCVAMLQLYEQGKFLMTDPVGTYLPELAHMAVAHHLQAESAPITMQQLFTMTSGLSYNLEDEALQTLYREKPNSFTTRDFARAVGRMPLLFQPGEHWYYSLAHDVLAACVEVLSGMRFSDYLKKYLFDPLEMKDLYFHVPQSQLYRSCVRYRYDAASATFLREVTDTDTLRFNTYQRSENFESGGAGLSTTLAEYAKFANMLTGLGVGANGKRVIAASTLNLMRENQLTPEQLCDFNWTQFRG